VDKINHMADDGPRNDGPSNDGPSEVGRRTDDSAAEPPSVRAAADASELIESTAHRAAPAAVVAGLAAGAAALLYLRARTHRHG
jgi:hypothetical protein